MGGKKKYIKMFSSFTEPINLYSALCITITTVVLPILSNHFPPFMTIHSIIQFDAFRLCIKQFS